MITRLRRIEFVKLVVAIVALTILLATTQIAGAQSKAVPLHTKPTDIQLAIEKGLFFVERESMRWWKNRKCTTCHEGHILLVAANVAKSQGVPVDQEKLDFWSERWVMVDRLVEKKDGRSTLGILRLGNELSVGSGADTTPFVLLHRDFPRDASATRADMWAKVLRNVFTSQQDDGRWDRDPKKEPSNVTPLMALALASFEESKIALPPELRREITERRKRTEDWIKSHELQRPEKTESLAGWVTYEHQRGDAARAKKLLEELLGRRNADGGWGIKKGAPSHLLVTSVVLLTLKTSGLPNDNPVVADTQRYLLGKQSEDGRWRELGRHFHPDKYYTQYDVWTTGYAIAALTMTMPKLPPGTKRLFTPDPKLVAEVEQWTKSAVEGFDRAGDPTQSEAPQKP